MNKAENYRADSLSKLEAQMKEIWSEYICYLEKNGFDETAKTLKNKYFRTYQNYQKNKQWRNLVSKDEL